MSDQEQSDGMEQNVVNLEAIRAQVEDRVQAEEEKRGGGSDNGGPVDSGFIRGCLEANELGDGILFGKLHRGKFLFNKFMDDWLIWSGHHWDVDVMERAPAAVEEVVKHYQGEAVAISKQVRELDEDKQKDKVRHLKYIREKLNQRVTALRSTRRRKNCLSMAHTCKDPLAIRGDEIDRKPLLLACANGVVDLETGEMAPGRPEDYLLKASPVEWQGIDAPCPVFKQALQDILSENKPLYRFLQRAFGYAMLGEVRQSVIMVLAGQGRNGKSLIVNTISDVMGPLAGAIRAEMLLDQGRVANSAGPTPDIMALRGLRMAFASESDQGSRFSPSRVKWLTGNDRLTGRNPHDKHETQFSPTHTLFLLTNNEPQAPPDDFAFWERVFLVPFDVSFVDREPRADNERRSDPQLPAKLRAEWPGILAWLVRGCIHYQREGLAPPLIVREATKEYRSDLDSVSDFIEVCLEEEDTAETGATLLYWVFAQWWDDNVGTKVMSQKRFGTLFGKRFPKKKKPAVCYIGVKLTAQGFSYLDQANDIRERKGKKLLTVDDQLNL